MQSSSPRYEILDCVALDALPPLTWVVNGALPATGVAAIYGPSGSAKTFLALSLADAISRGQRWFGLPTHQSAVVYMPLEGMHGLKKRLKALTLVNQCKPKIGVLNIRDCFNIANERDVRDLEDILPSKSVLIIDTLSRSAPGLDENSGADMNRLIEMATRLTRRTGGLVVFIHHTGKNVSAGMRGHSSFHAAVDGAIEVRRTGNTFTWKMAKLKDGPDDFSHKFRLREINLPASRIGDPAETSCVIEPLASGSRAAPVTLWSPGGANQRKAREVLQEQFELAEKNTGTRELDLAHIIDCIVPSLTCADKHRRERAKTAVNDLMSRGEIVIAAGRVRPAADS